MNVLFSLTPKNVIDYLTDDMTVRQALEKIKEKGYSMVPVIERDTGLYVRSVRANDLLDYIMNERLSFQDLEERPLAAVRSSWEIKPIGANADIRSLVDVLVSQNYAPVVDSRGIFIGIVTRSSVMKALKEAKSLED
ncbi:MAG: CBS domain-containing protein [Bacilli bacterium]|nr:CBS domain-containing protein [Bacilli bacterium]